MATSQILAATPHMLRLLLTGGGGEGGDAIDIPQATLVTDCAAGPLKELFTSPFTQPPPGPGATAWTLLHKDSRLSVMLNGFGLTPSTFNGYIFEVVSNNNVLHVSLDNSSQVIVEIRFDHSNAR